MGHGCLRSAQSVSCQNVKLLPTDLNITLSSPLPSSLSAKLFLTGGFISLTAQQSPFIISVLTFQLFSHHSLSKRSPHPTTSC